jgi:hypothetical protein
MKRAMTSARQQERSEADSIANYTSPEGEALDARCRRRRIDDVLERLVRQARIVHLLFSSVIDVPKLLVLFYSRTGNTGAPDLAAPRHQSTRMAEVTGWITHARSHHH